MTRNNGDTFKWAMRIWGGRDGIDLSTAINRVANRVDDLWTQAWTSLPTRVVLEGLLTAVRVIYPTDAPRGTLAGEQAMIHMIPRARCAPVGGGPLTGL